MPSRPVKLLVFAHTPPPHHGQSYMVKVLLDGLSSGVARPPSSPAEPTVVCFHVDARYSADLQDMGGFRLGKVLALFRYCAQAVALRVRHGIRTLYFVPSPPRRMPLLRDMLTLALLRPWFPRVVFHWHAAGLGTWLQGQPAWLRLPAHWLLGGADLSIALAALSAPDAEQLEPKRSSVVHYGIADLFPDFAERLGPARQRRALELESALGRATHAPTPGPASAAAVRIRVLFIAMCTREKGLFDALSAVAAANDVLAQRGNATRFELHVAGGFPDAAERDEVERLVAARAWHGLWHYHGFVSGEQKARLFEAADLMLFPTFYSAESFPVVVLEAMCAGLPVLTTRHRAIPEMLPSEYSGLVEPHDVAALTAKLPELAASTLGPRLREHYCASFTLERFVGRMAEVISTSVAT